MMMISSGDILSEFQMYYIVINLANQIQTYSLFAVRVSHKSLTTIKYRTSARVSIFIGKIQL